MTKQKLYKVRFRDIASIDDYYLNYDTSSRYWSIDSVLENRIFQTTFTKKELEESGFGWVFDSPLTEVLELL